MSRPGRSLTPAVAKRIKLVIFDVDGVLTDAGIYVGQSRNIIVRNSIARYNVAGIEIENCYYADVCLGGCTWTAHCTLGRPGNNPYCIHRALDFARADDQHSLEIRGPFGCLFDPLGQGG